MKNIAEIYDLKKLQRKINNAVKTLNTDYENIYDNTYIVETIINGHHGIYCSRFFLDIFYEQETVSKLSEQDIFEDIYNYFDDVENEIRKYININSSYELCIGFNENDGSIELFVIKD